MKVSKAIEILELECTSHKLKSDPDYLASARLGIEALNRIQHCRKWSTRAVLMPLLNETAEDDAT